MLIVGCREAGRSEWCAGETWCVKTFREGETEEVGGAVGVAWGCGGKGPGQSACQSETRTGGLVETVCYCQTDLCNGAEGSAGSLLLLLLPALTALHRLF